MGIFKVIRDNVYLRNLIVFAAVISGYFAQNLAHNVVDEKNYLFTFVAFAWIYILYVFHNRIVYEKIYRRYGIAYYTIATIAALVVNQQVWFYLLPLFGEQTPHYTTAQYIGIYWANTVFLYLAFGIYLVFQYAKKNELLAAVEKEKRQLELGQLKQQFNPHFLFNALNSIYSYSLKNDKVHTGELLLKMSDMMRAILCHSSEDSISLPEEVLFIENYISFETESLGKRCQVKFTKELVTDSVRIAPFILYAFVENAFKYGADRIKPTDVVLSLRADVGKLNFSVVNSKSNTQVCSTSLGLNNTKKRLEIIYPGRHNLQISETSNEFAINLTLDI